MSQPHSVHSATTDDAIKAFDYFGDRISWLDRQRMQASLRVRRQMYTWLRDRLGGVAGKVILDHGSTPDTEHIDSNCFIQWLLDDGAIVYATSPEPIAHLETVFPGLHVVAFPPDPTCGQRISTGAVLPGSAGDRPPNLPNHPKSLPLARLSHQNPPDSLVAPRCAPLDLAAPWLEILGAGSKFTPALEA